MHNNENHHQRPSLSQDMLNNFYLWDAQNEERDAFKNFPRDEKFQRIFVVLDLLTHVFESDLAMFIVKFSRRLRSSIGNENHRPLICEIVFNESVLIVNATIKNIISLLVDMIALKYPKENIRILSRLLALITQITNLHEYPDETFAYPSYNNLTMDLTRTVQKTIESSRYYSIELYAEVCEKLRSPLLQMLLVNEILTKIHGNSQPVSLKVPFESIRKKEFLKFKEAKETVLKSCEKFPTLDPKHKQKRCEVTQQSYLKLLLLIATAVNDFYRIQSAVKEINRNKSETASLPVQNQPDFTSFPEKLPEVIDLNEETSLRSCDSFKKLVHIKLTIETCEFYRNEIKHFMILPKLIKKCSEKYEEKFSEWMKLIKEMDKV